MVSTTEVCSSMETSEVYTVKAPNSGDANSGHIFLERQELVQNLIRKPVNSGHLCVQQQCHQAWVTLCYLMSHFLIS